MVTRLWCTHSSWLVLSRSSQPVIFYHLTLLLEVQLESNIGASPNYTEYWYLPVPSPLMQDSQSGAPPLCLSMQAKEKNKTFKT